jgi:molecular chaperone DnaK (HSP70)
VVKRLIGRNFSDKEIQSDIKKLPYKIINIDGKPYVQVSTNEGDIKNYSPE